MIGFGDRSIGHFTFKKFNITICMFAAGQNGPLTTKSKQKQSAGARRQQEDA
jgi:hypothetical protein